MNEPAGPASRRCRRWAFALAFAFAAALAYDLWHVPVQVSDSLGEIIEAQQSPSVWSTFTRGFGSSAYLRPLRLAQIKALFDLSGGWYRLAFRGFHIALLVAFFVLFTRALRVHSGVDLAAAAFALTVLVGMHTFMGFVREAFPINHFLEMGVACLIALELARSRGGWRIDAAAAAVLAVAVLTLESGLLVWVVLVAARLGGFRGVSTRGVALATLVLAGYFALRFQYLSTGVPGLQERASGFLTERLEPDELDRRFGGSPGAFYAYNVAASALSVLVGEPRDGVLVAVRSWREGPVPARIVLAVGTTSVTTAVVLWWAVMDWRRRRPWSEAHALALVAGAVVAASAALSFAYTKDEIMAVAGAFYALAAYGAARAIVERAGALRRAGAVAVVSMLLLALAAAWAVRAASVDHRLRRQAFRVRNDWADVHARLVREERWPADQQARQLVESLRADALFVPVPNPNLLPSWTDRWFDD